MSQMSMMRQNKKRKLHRKLKDVIMEEIKKKFGISELGNTRLKDI